MGPVKNSFVAASLLFLVYSCKPAEKPSPNERWSEEKAWAWQKETGWLCGCNFQPSTAVNQLEMWQEDSFDPETIDLELGWAEDLGFNVMRVYLHSYAWKKDPEGFKMRLDKYLAISDGHGIGTIFVFFDDCWNPDSKPGPQPEPEPGIHNSQWIQDPSCDLRSDTSTLFPWLEKYVKDILNTFKNDPRVLVWDLYNEPGNEKHYNESLPLLTNVFLWSREINPSQPLTAGIWSLDLTDMNRFQINNSDIITYHQYQDPEHHKTWLSLLKFHGRPMICTEYMARHFNSKFQNILPMLHKENIGAVNWGFVTGKTNTVYKWDKPVPDGSEPDLWFHDILRKNGQPYGQDEIDTIKKINNK